jgi:hypothetical protein
MNINIQQVLVSTRFSVKKNPSFHMNNHKKVLNISLIIERNNSSHVSIIINNLPFNGGRSWLLYRSASAGWQKLFKNVLKSY